MVADKMDYKKAREEMVRLQIEARGITDERVLKAMRRVPRHEFVGEAFKNQAYEDYPLSVFQLLNARPRQVHKALQ